MSSVDRPASAASPAPRALAAALAALLGGSVALGACYPEFRFGEETDGTGGSAEEASSSRAVSSSSSGTGGAPSATTSTSATTSSTTSTGDTSSSSTGTGAELPQLSCNDGGNTTPAPCQAGQICCFDEGNPTLDACSDDGCGANQFPLACDGPEDCPGQICCAQMRLSRVLQLPRFDGSIGCADSCAYPDHVVCHSDADCGGGACVPLFDGDYTYYAPEYDPHYRVCFQL